MNRHYIIGLTLLLATFASASAQVVQQESTELRDPHAYSAGYTQNNGPYTLSSGDPLKLADEHIFMSVLGDRIEFLPEESSGAYELQAWRGTSFNRLVIKTEGSFGQSDDYENTTELLWGHAFNPFWDSQVGLRVDTLSEGKNRQWLAAGIQGLAPYWFELDVTAYVGTEGQTEFVFNSKYELLLTQRLILQPKAELTVRGKDDAVNLLGKGFSSASLSLRLRYEFSRQFASFIGVESQKSFGNTAKFISTANNSDEETRYFAGVRFWF